MCGSANIGCRTCMGGSLLAEDDLIVRPDAIGHVELVVENWLVSAPRKRFSTYTSAELVSEQLLPPQDTNSLFAVFLHGPGGSKGHDLFLPDVYLNSRDRFATVGTVVGDAFTD